MTAWTVHCQWCGPLGSFTDCGPERRARDLADTHETMTGHVAYVDPPTSNKES